MGPISCKERQGTVTLAVASDYESTECIPSPHNPIIILSASAHTCFPKSNPRYHSSDYPKGKVESSFLSFKNDLGDNGPKQNKDCGLPQHYCVVLLPLSKSLARGHHPASVASQKTATCRSSSMFFLSTSFLHMAWGKNCFLLEPLLTWLLDLTIPSQFSVLLSERNAHIIASLLICMMFVWREIKKSRGW